MPEGYTIGPTQNSVRKNATHLEGVRHCSTHLVAPCAGLGLEGPGGPFVGHVVGSWVALLLALLLAPCWPSVGPCGSTI